MPLFKTMEVKIVFPDPATEIAGQIVHTFGHQVRVIARTNAIEPQKATVPM